MPSNVELSCAVSHALRHEPWLYELELDGGGWAPVDQLIVALRRRGGDWDSVDRIALERMLASSSKRRHELDGERIRALYGHSASGRIQKRHAVPPARLFHGTASETWSVIAVEGLLPMRRQFVHLSADRETATSVGRRKSRRPVVLVVDAAAAASAGIAFFEASRLVWLTASVPARFIVVAE